MKPMMTEQDTVAAVNALADWFKSQDIMPADASMVMSRLIAVCLVEKQRDIKILEFALKNYYLLLNIDVASRLRETA